MSELTTDHEVWAVYRRAMTMHALLLFDSHGAGAMNEVAFLFAKGMPLKEIKVKLRRRKISAKSVEEMFEFWSDLRRALESFSHDEPEARLSPDDVLRRGIALLVARSEELPEWPEYLEES